MNKAEIEKAWNDTCGDIVAGIGMSLEMGLARQKGKTAAEVKRDFYIELCKVAYEAGCKRGYAEAEAKFK